MRIQDSVAFVTGASRGLGRAFAEALHARGAKKVYGGSREIGLTRSPDIVPVRMDVTDFASVGGGAAQCGDVNLLINNAGIARPNTGALDPSLIETAREIFETNFYGLIRTSQAFAPILAANGGGAIVNVLSDATWFARPVLTAYSASKSAAWNFTNALRVDLRVRGTLVLALHAGYIDTDLAKDIDAPKSDPRWVADRTLDAIENDVEELLVDRQSMIVKHSLSAERPYYIALPD